MIIGIAGYAGAGKDTAAAALASLPGWRQDSLAAPLKAMALDLNPWIRIPGTKTTGGTYMDHIFTTLQGLFETCGRDWERAKRYEGVREFLQRLGTEGVRKHLGENVWADALYLRHITETNSVDGPSHTVVADVRFPNEALICDQLLLVIRPGVGPVNDHPSDAGLPHSLASHIIVNDGSIKELHEKVRKAVSVQ